MSLFIILYKNIVAYLGNNADLLINSAVTKLIEYNFEKRMYCISSEKIQWLKEAKNIINLDTSNILENIKWSKWARFSYINGDLCNMDLDEKNRISGTSINLDYETNILPEYAKLKLELEKNKYMIKLIVFRKLYSIL